MYEYDNKNKITSNKKILIIGGVAAGASAASKARRIDHSADIKIIQNEHLVSYGSCGFPYVIQGVVDNFNKLIARSVDEFKNRYNVEIITNTNATRIDPVRKQVHTKDLEKNGRVFDYDSLIISTGARAIVPKIKGIDDKDIKHFRNLFTLRNFEDANRIQDFIKNVKTAIIVGAGLIGIEMAEALKKRGVSVIVIQRSNHVLSGMIDDDMAELVEEELVKNGVNLLLQENVEEIVFSNNISTTTTSKDMIYAKGIRTNKREVIADCILIGVGIVPNSEIAYEAGIKLGAHNAIKVDNTMRTNIPNIFAAGDCVTARNYITNNDDYLPLGTTANKQGRIAGENAVRCGNTQFRGIAGSSITKAFGLLIAKTGLNKEEAKMNGFDPIDTKIEDITRAGYYPDNKPIWIKLISDKRSRRILGAQIVGGESVKGRIDLISFALLMKATVDDLASFDACYVPPISPVWDPITIVSMELAKLLNNS
jgi:NADPH-dependent 2,4-dienoyl-CoA reductase/sulfur reductase-like enzyme